jgi:hypothetical protein
MVKLEGIIYKTFNHYVVLRGFAPIKDLAAVSHKPDAYQRPAIEQHKEEIISFLSSGEYKYFPEITLACRVEKYDEFARNIGINNAVDRDDAQFVTGLKVLVENLPYGYRARHAYLKKNDNKDLVRVDGNHRLEFFDENYSDWWLSHDYDKKSIQNLIVPFTIIFSEREFGDKFEAGIFHNINFKQEPLRQEASLKIISDLGVFDDKEKLGEAYPLALRLIDIAKNSTFDSIHWLKNNNDIANDYYRTACLRIIQLLLNRKTIIEKELKEENDRLSKKGEEVAKNKLELEKLQKQAQSSPKKALQQQEEQKNKIQRLENEGRNLDFQQQHIERRVKRLSDYLEKINDISEIKKAITSLGHVYESFEGKKYGNIAFLSAMVYYSLLDKTQLQAFIHWAVRNGINKVNEPDDLSKDSAENLIKMFEQIFQSKKNEVFVSMQFGDPQSELIYEKIVRAIEQFNTKYTGIHLNVYPIRIDRTVESSTYSIQDRILEAIKSCSLIIADLSSQNINVYHEIGYAMGVAQANNLLPNMILLYKEDTQYKDKNEDTDKFIGFNLRNLSQLRFKDYKQLVDGLIERLEKHYEV